MADQLQLRGGSTAQTAAFTGALREVTVDTDKKTVVVHDGTTAGGNPLLRQDLSNLPAGTIDNADINASAGIVDTKLATIATAGKVSNSATTATNANTASAIVARDGSGNFTAGTITAALTGAASSNVLKAGDTMTGNLTVPSLNGGPLAGFRNRIINGNFDIWQRGTSFSSPATDAYTADRWVVVYNGSGATRTITQKAFAVGSTEAAPGAALYLEFDQTVAGSGGTFNVFQQRIEDVRTFEGQTVTVSFYARGDSAALTLPSITLAQAFGSGGSATVFNTVATSVVIAGTNFAKYTYTVTLPSISGKTIGTGSHLALEFALPINATFNFHVASVQLEPGTVATPFERRPIGTELAMCQRYALALTSGQASSIEVIGHGYNAGGGLQRFAINFPTTMRATPTLAFTSGSAADLITDVTGSSPGAFAIENGSPFKANIARTITGGTSGGAGHLRVNGISDVRFIASSEL